MFKMFKYLLLLFIQCLFFNIGEVNSQDMLKDNLLGAMINELYLLYKDAYENEKTYVTRRFFTNHNHYTLHVQKLKEVNGWKTHNLKVESNVPWGKPVVYINNPVECHMPNAFFSREQFQKIMLSRIEEQKKRFSKDNIDLIKANKYFETHTPLPSNINVNAHQVIDKIKDEIIDALDSQITRNSEAINTRTTEELIITTVSNKNEAQEILRDMSPYTYKNTVKKSTKTIPGFKMTKEMKLTAKMRRTHPRNENTKSKTTKSNILTRSHLASNKKIKRKVATTTNPISKFVPIPDENESMEEISTNIMTNSKEIIEKSTVRDFPSTEPLTSTEPTIDVTIEAVVSSTKVTADETTKETTTREPEVTITKTETTKNTDIDVTVHTESTATITSTDSTTDATTKTVVSDTTATTEATQSTKRRTRQRRPYVFFNN